MEGMYQALLPIHNVLRWVVIVAAAVAVAGAWHGLFKGREFGKGDRLRGVAYVASMHTQLLLGLTLYVNSPLVRAAMDDVGAAMGVRGMRFFLVEHTFLMILAVIVVQAGSVLSKRADDDRKKHKRAAIFYTLGLVLILGGIPWFRPMFPGL